MVSHLDNLVNRHRRFHQQASGMIAANGVALDIVPVLPTLLELHRQSLSSIHDPRYNCQHRPVIDEHAMRELVDSLLAAQLGVIEGEVGRRISTHLLDFATEVMGLHHKPQKERSRQSARRDVVRTAVCAAIVDAMDATLNAVIAGRLSKAAKARVRKKLRHG
ncbi:hypothetical protein [Bosea sp. (in: a-proteobacteria)]|jgi:hypothetical protein|uniref:hypothetical protein n=1 Tax=Bosea sp. (in: a-proteobacteria) TaxID=1871050 RepID=UPI002B467C98|nr:hypothetical protein [Bosea sp. (in: a-proteobacteria)]WRH56109.1 MAG: hypothetical protein RSE11_13710 [Bosea sp. (in: a-proteobacteria)]